MAKGNKVTHRHFSPDEYVTMGLDGRYILEDEVKCHPVEFWRWRTDESWNTDWELIKE